MTSCLRNKEQRPFIKAYNNATVKVHGVTLSFSVSWYTFKMYCITSHTKCRFWEEFHASYSHFLLKFCIFLDQYPKSRALTKFKSYCYAQAWFARKHPLLCVWSFWWTHKTVFCFVLFFSLRETHWGECHTPDVGGACAWPPLIWSISSMNTNPQHKERPINTSGSTWEIWFFSTSTCVWASSWSSWDCVASMLVPAKCLCAPWVWEECTLQKK